jgi:uncharacterized protein
MNFIHTRKSLTVAFAITWAACAGAETIPSKPDRYFNDYAGVVDPKVAAGLNEEMAQFERSNNCQIVAAIYQRMDSGSDIADYSQRVAETWGVGQKGKNNGLVIFVFIQDRKSYLSVGYGLEGKIPDIAAKRLIERELVPLFKQGNFTQGMSQTVRAVMLAARGEYKGVGSTDGESSAKVLVLLGLVVFIVIVMGIMRFLSSGSNRFGRACGYAAMGGWLSSPSSGSRSSWSGFSGGGGSFGGGGAGGSW